MLSTITCQLPNVSPARCYVSTHRLSTGKVVAILGQEEDCPCSIMNFAEFLATEALRSVEDLHGLHPQHDITWYFTFWSTTLQHMGAGEGRYRGYSYRSHFKGENPFGRKVCRTPVKLGIRREDLFRFGYPYSIMPNDSDWDMSPRENEPIIQLLEADMKDNGTEVLSYAQSMARCMARQRREPIDWAA